MRIYLTIVGLAYLGLAAWCAVQPAKTAAAVGFQLQPGSGQSEYFTVYGGLQTALGLLFLWPWLRSGDAGFVLGQCVAIHGTLVVFRAVSFVMYAGIPQMTYLLAATEWIIFLSSAALWWSTAPAARATTV